MESRRGRSVGVTNHAWLTLSSFTLGWTIIYLDRVALYPLLEQVRAPWGLSFTEAGLIVTTYFAIYVLMQIPAGMMGARIGLKRTLVPMYLASGLALAGVGSFANSYPALLVLIALHGAGAGAYYPIAYGITMQAASKARRGFYAAVVGAGMGLGSIVGFAAAAPLSATLGDWRLVFIALSVPTILLAVMFRFTVREGDFSSSGSFSILRVAGDPTLLKLNLMVFCMTYGRWLMYVWTPTFLVRERGVDPVTAGLLTAILAGVSIPADIFNSRLSDRVGRRKISLVLLPLSALSVYASASLGAVWMIALAFVAYGAFSSVMPIGVSWVGDIVSRRGGKLSMSEATAVYNVAGMLPAVVAPLVTGWLADVTGVLAFGYPVAAAVVLLGALFSYLTREE